VLEIILTLLLVKNFFYAIEMNKNLLKVKMILMVLLSVGYIAFASGFTDTKPSDNLKIEKIRYLENVFESVTIQKDVVFGESVNEKGIKESLKLDIYSPEADEIQNRPVIVWIHGGGFRHGNDKTQSYIVEMANRFARKGYVCLSIDYRLRENPKEDPAGTISDAVEDALKGLDWLRKNSESLKIDVSKIVIGGGSAGGMLGCNLCFNDRPGNKTDKNEIVGFVNLWGTPDLIWGELNIDKNDPPTIIVHGTEDKLVAYSNSEALADKLEANNVNHELITIEGAGHTPVKFMDDFEKKIAVFLYDLIK
jgi:acetyl esterase/lipase